MARLLQASRASKRVSDVVRTWWLLRRQKERRRANSVEAVLPLPVLMHHPSAGVPGSPLYDDIYLAENPGALVSDSVELSVLDPDNVTIEGMPPTETEWASAWSAFVTYSQALGRWHYENAELGRFKGDGDMVWIRGRFQRTGGSPGPWSAVDYYSGAGAVGWKY